MTKMTVEQVLALVEEYELEKEKTQKLWTLTLKFTTELFPTMKNLIFR